MLSSHCESMLAYAAAAGRRPGVLAGHRRYRPNVEVAPNCPRCDSPNTKFCYYNNYSLSQPRYFCKGCRRYWTKGGSLRNVPVGGGCRKNRRGKAVRAMVVDTAADAATSGAAPFSHRFHGPVRPDMLLEGTVAVGNPSSLDQPAVPDDKPPALHGSTIDLALLYAKFLNHNQPLAEQCAAVPESIDNSSGSSDYHMSPGAPAAATTGHVQDGLAEPSTELNFSVDQSCYDSLGLAKDGADLILPATWDQDARYDPFGSLPEDAISLHDHDVIAGGDDFWSNALGCQGLEAAVCRP